MSKIKRAAMREKQLAKQMLEMDKQTEAIHQRKLKQMAQLAQEAKNQKVKAPTQQSIIEKKKAAIRMRIDEKINSVVREVEYNSLTGKQKKQKFIREGIAYDDIQAMTMT